MSSGAPGKFQDHYIVLGVEPKADSETIQSAYTRLAQKFRPDNPETGNRERFEALNLAYEVLSDPELRAGFDKLKGIDLDSGKPMFSGVGFFDAMNQGTVLRSALLCVLYDRRRLKSFQPSLSLRNLENMLRSTNDQLNFALWYLKQRGYVVSDDKSNLQISVEGMDYLEKNQPAPDAVMLMLKPDSVAGSNIQAEPVLNVLNRALTESGASSDVVEASLLRR